MIAFLPQFNHSKQKSNLAPMVSFEEDLVCGLKNGDKTAVEKLYKMYAPSLLGIIARIVKFDEIAEDVLQDTFLKIWKSIAQYDSAKGKLFTWMANIARNTAIDQIRSKHYTHGAKTDDITEMPTGILDHFQLNLDTIGLKQLMLNLKPDQKKIIDLFYFEGYTHVEVAEKLNIPLGTVKTKIRHAIIALRQYFNETNRHFISLSA